ncbi:MAG TPA: ABC transporter permease [Mycobacteriales bacterium]|nr:ABC transporter permease [Mycobacteriales bacterium]
MSGAPHAMSPAFARRPFDLPGRGILGANVALVLVALLPLGIDLFGRGSLTTLTPVIGVMVLVALGQAFVIGTGGIDLSIPSTVTLVGVVILKDAAGRNADLWRALALCLLACLLIGLLNGVLVELLRLNALVVTLATGQLIAGATRMYRGQALAVTRVPDTLSVFARRSVGNVSVILLIAVAVAVAVALWLRYHTSGRRLAAASVARSAAHHSGLAATRQRITAWVIATVLVGLGAVLLAGQITTPDLTLGSPYLLTSVVAVVLGGAAIAGGRVKVAATVLGALFIVLLNQVFRIEGYSSGVSLTVQGLVLGVGLALVAYTKNVRWLSLRSPAATADSGVATSQE